MALEVLRKAYHLKREGILTTFGVFTWKNLF